MTYAPRGSYHPPPVTPDDLLPAALDRARGGALVVLSVPAPDVPVARLLDAVPEGDASLFDPHGGAPAVSVAGRGRAVHFTGPSLAALRPAVARALADITVVAAPGADASVRALGGQSFDPRRPHDGDDAWQTFPTASLTVPRWALVRADGRASLQVAFTRDDAPDARELAAVRRALEALAPDVGRAPDVAALPGDRDAWEALVRDALAVMREGRAEKLVGARAAELRADTPWGLPDVLARLDAPEGCARFAFEHHGALFLGASPERLVARDGAFARADALAGSLPRDADHDARDLRALLDSGKDRREHELVVAGIRDALGPLCESVDAPAAPVVRTLARLHHLWTPVRARLRRDAPAHVLDLVAALHPTPALGGAPRDVALDWIARREPRPRGWYAAPVGWCDAAGDGEFFVAIRAAVLRGERAWLWAGAGLVPGSDPAREWDETEAKLAAMRAALGDRR